MPSFKRFYMEKRKKTIQSRKNGAKLLQLAMISCSYNFIKLSMCSYNFNVAARISINRKQFFLFPEIVFDFLLAGSISFRFVSSVYLKNLAVFVELIRQF